MRPGTLVSYSQMTGPRGNRVEGHGTLLRVRGDQATIKTADGTVTIHLSCCQVEPTADEIKAACEIIRCRWSAEERDRRGRYYDGRNQASPHVDAPHVTVPTIRVAELLEALAG